MKVAIVGGSLGGLAAANVLHRLGASVSVFEKQPAEMSNRGACLGFVDIDLWERIRGVRMTWPDGRDVTRIPPPDGKQSFDNQGSFYYGDMWYTHMSVHISTHIFMHTSTHMPAYMSVHMSTHMYVHKAISVLGAA